MKGKISTATIVRFILAIAVIVLAPVLMRYWNTSPEPAPDQIAPDPEATANETAGEPTFNAEDRSAGTVLGSQPFRPIERKPRLLTQPNPGYPELAQHLRLEGTVLVKVLVDKQGHPRHAMVIKSDSEVFNETARRAAMEARFRPAVMNSGPVECWVLIPYRFKAG
jgi:protein TonB